MEQQTGSKFGKVYVKAVYCHLAYLTYMQNTPCKMLGWMKHKLELRLQREISITSDDTALNVRMGEFNSDDHYIYYCGQESLRRNGVAIIVNKRVQKAVLGYNLKNDRIISFVSKANHSISR